MIGEDLLDLGGQVALVTGARRGAGRATALELARHNAGGVAVKEFVDALMATDRAKAQHSCYINRRYGRPGDVAALVTFLCSDAASWITGQTYPLNGGYVTA